MSISELAAKAAQRKAKRAKRVAKVKKSAKHDFSNVDSVGAQVLAFSQINLDLEPKDLVKIAVEWAKSKNVTLTGIDDSKLHMLGKLVYYTQNGGKGFEASMEKRLEDLKPLIIINKELVKVQKERKSVQDYIADNTHDLMAEIDEWIDTGNFQSVKSYMAANKIKAINNGLIETKYIKLLREITSAVKKDDSQIVEAYRNVKETELKKIQAFLVGLIKETRAFVSEKISTRKPRIKKPVTAEKQVKKMKFSKDSIAGFKSIDPTKIVGAVQLWVFNTKYRKLGVFNALDGDGFKIKGTTLLNVNEKTSFNKKLRKPDEQVKALMAGGKVALRTFMDNIKAKQQTLKTRIGKDTILLRVQ